jgi:hypothetical protein
VFADRLQVDSDMTLLRARVTGAGELGALRQPDAHITGRLGLIAVVITNDSGPAVGIVMGHRSTR